MTELSQCTYKNTPKFTFKGKEYDAKVVKVYDGDTITVVFDFMSSPYRFTVRMVGYDSPELKSEDIVEKKYAIASRDFLGKMIMNKIVHLVCEDYDKYGRILGRVFLDGVDINEKMLRDGSCREYTGGHKDAWDFTHFNIQ